MSHLSFETRLPRSLSIFLLTPFLPLQTYAVSIFQSAEMTRAIDLFYSYSEFLYAKNLSKSLYLWSRKKKKTSLIAVHVENDTNDVYNVKNSWSAKEKRNCLLFYVIFSWLWDCVTNHAMTKKKLAVGFLNEKWHIVITVFKHRFTFYAENIFFSFYGKSFSGAFTNGFLPGISSPGTVFYHNTCFLVCHSFLLTIAIRTSFFFYQTGNYYCCPVILSLNMKYI